jgi:hypothetical protein
MTRLCMAARLKQSADERASRAFCACVGGSMIDALSCLICR